MTFSNESLSFGENARISKIPKSRLLASILSAFIENGSIAKFDKWHADNKSLNTNVLYLRAIFSFACCH